MNAKKIISEYDIEPQEISLINLLKSLWRRALIIILIAAAAAVFGFTAFSSEPEPKYEASYSVYIAYGESVDSEGNAASAQKGDGFKLLPVYKIIIENSAILRSAAADAGLDMDADDLRDLLKIDLSSESTLVTVSASGSNQGQLLSFLNNLENEAAKEMHGSIDNCIISVVDISLPVNTAAASSPMKYALVFAFAAIILCVLFIIGREIIENRVKSPQELELRTGILVLSSVPNASGLRRKTGREV